MRNTQATNLIFELSQPGRSGVCLAASDVPKQDPAEWFPAGALATSAPPLPEISEPDVVRHFTNLSTLNMSVDTHYYPLGSCTMKYNPKRNERIAAFDGLAQIHPYQPAETVQGMLQILYGLQDMLAEISGLPVVSLQPAAGAHGELAALMLAAAYYRERGEKRTTVLAPDSAHGTNPASARMAGFDFVTIPSCSDGRVDIEKLKEQLNDQTAVFMITNPSTLGLFDDQVQEISDLVHDVGGLIYLDGANMNAILGITRPGDFGA
ncbi:MAG: aminotransferase class V-fold PLP-dependent enzyme, partial [Planctomycetaceae bacterium]|nr:aminotransferase class V-fold PLP-dependent enzyme [Planctomycetaceae bacterium]